MLKRCTKCWEEKDISEFNKQSKSKDWLRNYCRECWKAMNRIYHATHKEQEREYQKQHIEQKRINWLRYYHRHKDEINAKRSREKDKNNLVKKNCAKKKPHRYALMKVWSWIIGRCCRENDSWYKYYWARWIKCLWKSFQEFYDGVHDSYELRVKEHWFWKVNVQIDRIDNDWHYCKENCRRVTAKQNNHSNHKKEREIRKLCFILSNINKNAL